MAKRKDGTQFERRTNIYQEFSTCSFWSTMTRFGGLDRAPSIQSVEFELLEGDDTDVPAIVTQGPLVSTVVELEIQRVRSL